jgi:hypothetical protein
MSDCIMEQILIKEELMAVLPTDSKERKNVPIASGVLDYFPAALAEIAKVSKAGNDQHNPGQPIHWARNKSTDQDDTIIRHFMERGSIDTDGQRHSAKLAWRALALLQLELEAEGAPMARGARAVDTPSLSDAPEPNSNTNYHTPIASFDIRDAIEVYPKPQG